MENLIQVSKLHRHDRMKTRLSSGSLRKGSGRNNIHIKSPQNDVSSDLAYRAQKNKKAVLIMAK